MSHSRRIKSQETPKVSWGFLTPKQRYPQMAWESNRDAQFWGFWTRYVDGILSAKAAGFSPFPK